MIRNHTLDITVPFPISMLFQVEGVEEREQMNTGYYSDCTEVQKMKDRLMRREYLYSLYYYQDKKQLEIAMIKDTIKRMSAEAENFLLGNDMLRHFTSDMMDAIVKILKENNFDKNEIEIFWYRDREVEDWENLCISIKINVKKYEEVIKYMNVVGKRLDVLKNEPQYHDNSHEIDKMISIIVDEL